MIGAILGIASLAASAFGAAKSAKANRAIDEQIASRQSELDNWYNKEYNQNYLDTDEAKSTVTLLREQLRDQMKKVDQNNAITGASDERRVATAEKLNRGFGDSLTRLAGYGTRHKDAARRQYMYNNMFLDNQELQNLQGKSQNWSNLMGNAMNTFGGAMEADAAGAFSKYDDSLQKWWSGMGKKAGGVGEIAPDILKPAEDFYKLA